MKIWFGHPRHQSEVMANSNRQFFLLCLLCMFFGFELAINTSLAPFDRSLDHPSPCIDHGFELATTNATSILAPLLTPPKGYHNTCNTTKSKLHKVGKSFLVTGGAGFIGMHTAIKLKHLGFQVVAIDNLNTYYSQQLKEDRVDLLEKAGVNFVEGDVCDENILLKTFHDFSVDRVIHLAAQAGVRYSLIDPHAYVRNNIDCHLTTFEAYQKAGLQSRPIIYASSSSVYGFNTYSSRFSESMSDADHPASLYAATKRAGELIAHTYKHLHNISSVGLRFFTVYGPWGRPDMSPMIFADRIKNNAGLTLNNYGMSVRDFTYIDDIVEGIIAAIHYKTDKAEIFNLGGHHPVQITKVVELIQTGLGKRANIVHLPMAKGDVPVTSADIRSAQCNLGWTPTISIETGIQRFIQWYQDHSASKYMPAIKESASQGKRVPLCVINSAFGTNFNNFDKPMNVSNITHPEKVEFLFFTNQPGFQAPGWKIVLLTDLPYKRSVTQSRWPKFQAMKHPVVYRTCEMALYIDVSSRLNKPIEDYIELAGKVHASGLGLAQAKHLKRSGIADEFKAIIRSKKDTVNNTIISLAWLTSQEDFTDGIQLWLNTFFMYDPWNKEFQQIADFFWKRYSKEVDSWRDQPLWSYSLHHFNATPNVLSYKDWVVDVESNKGHDGHCYVDC